MSGINWTDAERDAVDDRLAAFTVKVEPDDGPDEGFLTDHAREWVVKRALDALAPFVEARVRRAKAEALRDAADECDSTGHHWSGRPALAFFAVASDLRERAAREAGDDR